jgi:hypothetical protein
VKRLQFSIQRSRHASLFNRYSAFCTTAGLKQKEPLGWSHFRKLHPRTRIDTPISASQEVNTLMISRQIVVTQASMHVSCRTRCLWWDKPVSRCLLSRSVMVSVSHMANCNEDLLTSAIYYLSGQKPSRHSFHESDKTPCERPGRPPECGMPIVDWWDPRAVHG